MKKLFVFAAALMVLALPAVTLAHQHERYEIGDKNYEFTIGSLNEPIFVDDKTGVDFRVAEVPHGADEEDAGTPVTGLEQTLKVEVSAGDQKKTFDLSPAFGDPGAYRAPFYPTVVTTYTYRVFGTINNTAVNLSFTCNPAGHPATPEDSSLVNISSGVTRFHKSGAFGCPRARADVSFPQQVGSSSDLTTAVLAVDEKARSAGSMSTIGIMLGAIGLLVAVGAHIMIKKS